MLTHHYNVLVVWDILCPVQWYCISAVDSYTHITLTPTLAEDETTESHLFTTHTGLNQSSSTIQYNLVLYCNAIRILLISSNKMTLWIMCGFNMFVYLSPGHNMFVHRHHPAFGSPNIKCHLVATCLACSCWISVWVWGQSIWSLVVQVPTALLAVTSGRGVAYIICYEAWMSGSNYGKTQGSIYSCSFTLLS